MTEKDRDLDIGYLSPIIHDDSDRLWRHQRRHHDRQRRRGRHNDFVRRRRRLRSPNVYERADHVQWQLRECQNR